MFTSVFDKRIAKFVNNIFPENVNRQLAQEYMPSKFWLHRVDSVEKQKEFKDKYKGIEFDIVFYNNENAFENSHDPENLQKYNLEKQFAVYQDIGITKGIWLDFKNLTEENKLQAKETLEKLIKKYNIEKSSVWVESGNWKSLDIFHNDGYKTSYYLPYYEFEKMNVKEINTAKAIAEKAASSGNINAISFYYKYYDFVKGLDLPDNVAFLTWIDGRTWIEIMLNRKFQPIVNDNKIQVILVKDKGNYHR